MNFIEEYKYINGYNNKYCITNTGKVFVTDYRGKECWKEMKSRLISGYPSVGLRIFKDGKSIQKIYKIHRLVAEYFIENPNNYPVVNHIDGDKTNNVYTNLEWVTISDNTKHAIRTNLIKSSWNRELGIAAINLIENYNYNFADVQKLFKLKQRSQVYHFYHIGYKTFNLQVKNVNVFKNSKKKELPLDYKNYLNDLIMANTEPNNQITKG